MNQAKSQHPRENLFNHSLLPDVKNVCFLVAIRLLLTFVQTHGALKMSVYVCVCVCAFSCMCLHM